MAKTTIHNIPYFAPLDSFLKTCACEGGGQTISFFRIVGLKSPRSHALDFEHKRVASGEWGPNRVSYCRVKKPRDHGVYFEDKKKRGGP
jgi:hypothetical protein